MEEEVCGRLISSASSLPLALEAEEGVGSCTEERDILKKSGRVFRQGCKVKYAFIALQRLQFSVRTMCRLLRVHPGGFYAWLKNPLSRRASEDKRQTDLLQKAWEKSGKVYGYRKLRDVNQRPKFTPWGKFSRH